MKPLLLFAIAAMVFALAFYTIGVWSEKLAGKLKLWHLVLFWIGLIFDTTGTSMMGIMAGKMDFDLHGITGALAIVLMLSHAVWATIVLATRKVKWIQEFHKFSIFVWLIWLIPFITGLIGAMVH
jgi:uncharacterized repeat protein (TIGR03987 family)